MMTCYAKQSSWSNYFIIDSFFIFIFLKFTLLNCIVVSIGRNGFLMYHQEIHSNYLVRNAGRTYC